MKLELKVESLLKAVLLLLIVALAVVITSWATSERSEARAEGGGGGVAGNWIMVASELRQGEGLIYLFHTEKEVLLVYSYNRSLTAASTKLFTGDLLLLAGRLCKWDRLYSELLPYPPEAAKSGFHSPKNMQTMYEKANKLTPP